VLLLVNAGLVDHLGPALRLFLFQLGHIGRRAAPREKMQLAVAFHGLRFSERRVNRPVELGDDRSRGFRRCADGVPGIRYESWDTRFDEGGNVGQGIQPALGRDREDPRLSPGMQLVSRGKLGEHAVHLPADEVVERRTRPAIGDVHHPGAEEL